MIRSSIIIICTKTSSNASPRRSPIWVLRCSWRIGEFYTLYTHLIYKLYVNLVYLQLNTVKKYIRVVTQFWDATEKPAIQTNSQRHVIRQKIHIQHIYSKKIEDVVTACFENHLNYILALTLIN